MNGEAKLLDPEDADKGAPYVVIEPAECWNCGRELRISGAVVRELPAEWVYECWCGGQIRFSGGGWVQ